MVPHHLPAYLGYRVEHGETAETEKLCRRPCKLYFQTTTPAFGNMVPLVHETSDWSSPAAVCGPSGSDTSTPVVNTQVLFVPTKFCQAGTL